MRLEPEAQARVRREFFPEDYERALGLLTRWSTKTCAPEESPALMHAAVLNVALGDLAALKRAIGMARGDYRDVLFLGDDPDCRDRPCIDCEPGEGPWSPEEEAFLGSIRRRPADDTTRLVYADWLEERGEDRRAEYLRVLCRWLAGDPAADRELVERERELRAGLGGGWLARIRGMRVRDQRGRILAPRKAPRSR
ncbi:MAG TPA: TIGR02996 domain-containing protein [Gemmataceae bacterium]|nr:TIGR02996 domain-containing protein [Gemmataceae bacterium]